jgi:signal transduction histidine kinase
MDLVLPLVLAAIAVVELASIHPARWQVGAVIEVVACAALVPRRAWPLVSCTAAGVLATSLPWYSASLNDVATPILLVVVAVYSLARWVPDLRGLLGVALIALTILGDYLFRDPRDADFTDVIFVLSLMTPPYFFGRVARKMAVQAEQLRAQQDLIRDQAVREERDRIARELHDVIAHSVSAMVVQTAAAQDLVRTDPDRAETVLGDVASTGRRALVETGRLLHVIRDEHDELGLDPAPGLREVPSLVDAFRESGLSVDLVVDEPLPSLPAGLDVSAYRIVQEALTNALKHGADRTASLRVAATPTCLAIEASNPANGHSGGGSGLGLMGIGERVALLGGRLSHGVDGGQFRLSVTMPLAGEPS